MTGEYSIRPTRPDDTQAIAELLRLCLGGRKSQSFLNWKHGANPFGSSPGLVAEAEGRLVAFRTFLRWRFDFGGAAVDAYRPVDTATHPEWRRRGLFSTLTRQLVARVEREGAHLIFNTPGAASRDGYLGLGWQKIGRPPLLLKPSPGRTDRAGEAAPASEFLASADVERFLAGCDSPRTGSGRLVTRKSREFLAWRYADVPGFFYEVLSSSGTDGCAAVIVHSRVRRRFREVKLCEVLVGEGAASKKRAIELARGLGRRLPADYFVACAARSTRERSIYRRAGFLPVPAGPPPILGRRLEATTASIWTGLRKAGWSLGDLELF